eukprot:10203593-Lingulodinium_polyedra.AAC.1
MDVKARHVGCCAGVESTRGHYAVARQLYALARTAGPTTVRGEPAPGDDKQRPGDVVSNAFLLGMRTAVDVGICSQDSTRPGGPA